LNSITEEQKIINCGVRNTAVIKHFRWIVYMKLTVARKKMAIFELRQKKLFLSDINEGYVTEDQIMRLQHLIRRNPDICRILEVGFNGGNSAAAMLSVRSNINIVSFDDGTHTYVGKAKQLIDAMFPSRHTLILGDSRKTIPKFPKEPTFDAAFIDGGHRGTTPYLDIKNCCKLVKQGGLIIIDDMSYAAVAAAAHRALRESLITIKAETPDLDRPWMEARRS
jgi:predicted O-methyltransferase YrrM